MILCLCEGASDRELRQAVRAGCNSVPDLVRTTGAGSHCGQCKCDLKRIVADARAETPRDGDEDSPPSLAAK